LMLSLPFKAGADVRSLRIQLYHGVCMRQTNADEGGRVGN